MKRKNILFLVIDSVTNDVIFDKDTNVAPFIRSIRDKSITGDNMYSEAPFTEAALISLLASKNTMDNYGYMERMKNVKTLLEVFKENGYITFHSNYYPDIYPSYMMPGSTEKKYIEGYEFDSHVWEYRFKYFAPLYLEKKTTKKENIMLQDMLLDNFDAWITYLEKVKNNDIELSMIVKHIDKANIDDAINILKEERKKFISNKDEYLKDLFIKKEEHILFTIPKYKMTDKIHNDEFRDETIKRYKPIFDKINKANIKYNLRNNKFPFKKLIKLIFHLELRKAKALMLAYKNSLFDKDLYERNRKDYDLFKNHVSFRTIANTFIDFAKENTKSNWLAYVHVDDAHFNENFFTYDTTDRKLLDYEFKMASDYVDNLPKNYCGSITNDLSLNYCDDVVKMIFKKLKENNMLDNTDIIITADHGFSFRFCPVRDGYVNTYYKENYNVPFIIYGKDIKPRYINKFTQTYDIPATIIDLANIKESDFIGESLLKSVGKDYALLEYMGGGCPDYNRRPINLGVRTENYSVVVEAYINQDFKNAKIVSIYDLKKDKYEHNDLHYNKNILKKIEKELKILEKRFYEINKYYMEEK